jgi:hypothetical protein
MDNMIVIGVVALLLVALLVFINLKNKKDRRELEDKLNQDYKKPRDEEGDVANEMRPD